MMVTLPPDYRPTEDEEFMNPIQAEYFRQKLLRWRSDLLKEADGTLASLSEGGIHEADITDRASVETDRALELRTRDRARKLISKIDQALSGSRTAPTAIARRPASRSACAGWRPARSPPCRSRRRSATSAWSACTATTECGGCAGRRRAPFGATEGPMGDRSLYDEDILVWSEQQAAALRSLASRRDLPNELDLANVIEEIEDVGRSEFHASRAWSRISWFI